MQTHIPTKKHPVMVNYEQTYFTNGKPDIRKSEIRRQEYKKFSQQKKIFVPEINDRTYARAVHMLVRNLN